MTAPDMTGYLADEEIGRLRMGYDRGVMLAASQGSVGDTSPAAALVGFLGTAVYDADAMAPADRERCILALLATRPHALTLGVHVYWGLAEGLSLRDIYQVLVLAAGYAGVDAFAVPAFLLRGRILPLLKGLAAEGAPSTPQVLQALIGALA
ncbi:MAG: hypothetical protein R3F60_27770 [bacterium]